MSDNEQTYGLVLPFDTDDPEFVRGWTLGQIWERLDHQPYTEGTISTSCAEMVMRIAEAKGLPFTADVHDDAWMWVTIGTPPDLEAT